MRELGVVGADSGEHGTPSIGGSGSVRAGSVDIG
jgi:hypothetical protein